jgi:hypothetical protein
MSGTDYYRKKALDNFTSVAAYVQPAIYLALFTADPTESGSLANEVPSGVGYARQPLAGVLGAADPSGFCVNTSVIDFGPASATWGTITNFGVMDSATLGAGNMLETGAPNTPRTINAGQPLQIPVGQLRLRLT